MSVETQIEMTKRPAVEAESYKIQRRQARKLKLFEPALVRAANCSRS